jgi:hypothetical protein
VKRFLCFRRIHFTDQTSVSKDSKGEMKYELTKRFAAGGKEWTGLISLREKRADNSRQPVSVHWPVSD